MLVFDTPHGELIVDPHATVLALGGASWPKLGSTGAWIQWLERAGVKVEAFRPTNCGFNVKWSDHFRENFHGQAVKSVTLSFGKFKQRGEFIITRNGIQGNLIYRVSSLLRDEIESKGIATISLDLAPDIHLEKMIKALSRPRNKRSLAGFLERTIKLKGVKIGLLHEFIPKDSLSDIKKLAAAIKELNIPLISPRPIEEAISSAGGVRFDELDSRLMLKRLPGVFCAGEMLDWEAPTGGYLLTACFATGHAAGLGVLDWLV